MTADVSTNKRSVYKLHEHSVEDYSEYFEMLVSGITVSTFFGAIVLSGIVVLKHVMLPVLGVC